MEYTIQDWEGPGPSGSRLVPYTWPSADVAVLCYSVGSRESVDKVRDKWAPEREKYCPGSTLVLLAMKVDLRGTESEKVDFREGQELMQQIGATAHFNASAKNIDGVVEVMAEIVRAHWRNQESAHKRGCQVM